MNANEVDDIPLLIEILSEWKETIGPDYEGYLNHASRMIHFSIYLGGCGEEEQEKIIIAAAFHDIGLWIDGSLDYIPPSIPPALKYLKRRGLGSWSQDIGMMIREHHKIRPLRDPDTRIAELFRRGDLADFSLGLIRFGIPKPYLKEVRARFPNAGFHKGLCRKAARWFVRHPLNPMPMMKW